MTQDHVPVELSCRSSFTVVTQRPARLPVGCAARRPNPIASDRWQHLMNEPPPAHPADMTLDRLRRWELFGGHWRVRSRTSARLEIALLSCSGGEEADRLVGTDPTLIAYVGSRTSDQDDWPAIGADGASAQ
jgi:hypothetical protein